eukprot:12998972-Alexandrium_andersonii.AAC.1
MVVVGPSALYVDSTGGDMAGQLGMEVEFPVEAATGPAAAPGVAGDQAVPGGILGSFKDFWAP